uniref:VWFD domain-containing protein n=1 Tax=Ciona savignyi TaxID=51511 RepID=H2Z2Z9_CIOSA
VKHDFHLCSVCGAGLWNCSSDFCGAITRCPNNMVFNRKMTPCSQISCENMDRIDVLRNNGHCDEDVAYEGCTCPRGSVLLDSRCVQPSECPCRHGGRMYTNNQTIQRDCNTCKCVGRRWECTDHKCSSVCVATGDPHYVTFDGAHYSFEGACGYVLAREVDGLFSITGENVPCGSHGVTCTKSVYVTVGSNTVHLMRGKSVSVNGGKVGRLPRKYGAHDDGFAIRTAGIYVTISWPTVGLALFWDGGTRVTIHLSPRHVGRVTGLCGNNDMDLENEFTTRLGSVETSLSTFADSWRVSPVCSRTTALQTEIISNPCEANPHRFAWSRRTCSIISTGSVFATCRSAVPHSTYFNWCVHDACSCDTGGDCECACTAIAAYAQACNRNNVHIRWRSQELCPMQCDNGMVYLACGPVCQDTCRGRCDVGYYDHCSTLPCVEGCFCPEGTVLHERRCVSRNECPCFSDDGEFLEGTFVTRNCQNCSCVKGEWICQGEACNDTLCGSDEFTCQDGLKCIPSSWRCDHEVDCMDGSDEIRCNESYCADSGGHMCGEGRCLEREFRCNGIPNCLDLSDEGCSMFEQFACGNGGCVNRTALCDGRIDCVDGLDELNCACLPTDYTCADGACIVRNALCDEKPDCAHGEDELNCGQITTTPTIPTTTMVLSTVPTIIEPTTSAGRKKCAEFWCENDPNVCIPWMKVCNNVADCRDDSDESEYCWTGCSESEFQCDGGLRCYPTRYLCDGHQHCIDGTDENEESCHIVNTTDSTLIDDCFRGFQCQDGSCINGSQVCDGVTNCGRNEDEIGCDGMWSPWQPWSQCSHTCGGGVHARKRACDSPAPLNGGRECPGVCSETKVCNAMPCIPDCGWSSWSSWSQC